MLRFLKTDSATSPTTLEPVGWPVARRELLGRPGMSHESLKLQNDKSRAGLLMSRKGVKMLEVFTCRRVV